MNRLFILVLILFCTFRVASQVDSLNQIPTAQQILHYQSLAHEYFRSEPIKGLAAAEKLKALSNSVQDTNALAESYKMIGNINYILGNYTEALDHFIAALSTYTSKQDTLAMAGMYGSMGLVYKATKDYSEALKAYDKAHELNDRKGNNIIKAKIYNNQGVIYRHMKNYEKAGEYFRRSLDIKMELGDKSGIANSITNLGNVSADDGAFSEAINYFNQSLAIERSLDSKEGIIKNLNNIANTLLQQEKYEEAAIYANQGLTLAQDIATKVQLKEATEVLAKAYYKMGKYKLAYDHLKNYTTVKDSLFNDDKARKIGRLQSKVELLGKQREVDNLAKANEIAAYELRQKRTQYVFLVSISLLAMLTLTYIVWTQKQKNKLREKALQAELLKLRFEIKTLIGKYEGGLNISLKQLNKKLVNPLSEREYDVFKQIFTHKTNSEIAEELYVSINTVKTHLKNLYGKLGVSNRKEALNIILND